jgi:2-polyprenyl-6-methoxyphenol hydroxylase-like FAD-dependent oxidoreductase
LRIDIIGGGIGGLALAVALHRLGLDFSVFEQAPELKAIGYGLTLQKNALDALGVVGVAGAVRSRGVEVRQGQFRQPSGRVLASPSVELCAIHRSTLVSVLAAHTPSDVVHLGRGVEEATDADFIVAADGLNSAFRRMVVAGETPPRDSGYTAWRGIAPRSADVHRHIEAGVVSETWGRGTRFGIVPIDGDQIYWFAVAPVDPLRDASSVRRFLLNTFSAWHPPIGALIRDTSAEAILESRIVDRLPIPVWHKGNVILLGDAAHPMTPNLGQGGCQAIEDGVVLAHLLGACRDGKMRREEVALSYEKSRRTRVYDILDQSFALGRLARYSNPIFVVARDALFRIIPPRVQQRRLARIVTFPGVPA